MIDEYCSWDRGIKMPSEPNWRLEMFGMGPNGYTLNIHEGTIPVPNFFWRWMQYILLGNKWVRINRANT